MTKESKTKKEEEVTEVKKPKRVRRLNLDTLIQASVPQELTPIRKIAESHPGIPLASIRNALKKLIESNVVVCEGAKKGAKYRRVVA